MQITFDTASQRELDAIAALIASLGGRAHGLIGYDESEDEMEDEHVRRNERPSDALMQAAAASARVPAAPAADGKPPLTTLDKSGVPWDERIHSSAQTINTSDGMWRSKRGISEVAFGQIHAELQAKYVTPNGATGTAESGTDAQPSTPVPTAPVAPTAPAAPPAPDQTTDTSTTGTGEAPLAPAAPSAPTAAAPPAPTAAASATGDGEAARWSTWAEYVKAVNSLGPEASAYANLNAMVQMVGVDKFASLMNHPDKWAEFWSLLGGQ